jgi:hypothetical protein
MMPLLTYGLYALIVMAASNDALIFPMHYPKAQWKSKECPQRSMDLRFISIPKLNNLKDYESLIFRQFPVERFKVIRWFLSRIANDRAVVEVMLEIRYDDICLDISKYENFNTKETK